jgi:hypothetical protein
MKFLYKTTAVYEQSFSAESIALTESKIDELMAQGKTDGSRNTSWPVLPAWVTRPWIDEAAAEEWKNYCLSIEPAPVSFEVEKI